VCGGYLWFLDKVYATSGGLHQIVLDFSECEEISSPRHNPVLHILRWANIATALMIITQEKQHLSVDRWLDTIIGLGIHQQGNQNVQICIFSNPMGDEGS
jgi:hypothetical protein